MHGALNLAPSSQPAQHSEVSSLAGLDGGRGALVMLVDVVVLVAGAPRARICRLNVGLMSG